jgi:hypothetical protein
MAKRNFAALMLAGIAILTLPNNARAEEPYIGVDGCAVLAQLVYAEVAAAPWYGSDSLWSLANDANNAGIAVCYQTARTVSRAFSSAMTSKGSPVRWGYPSVNPGDACLSTCLDRCHPDSRRLGATWRAVRKTVRQAMTGGVTTDQSIFNASTLRRALRFALDEKSVGTIAPFTVSPRGVGAKARQPRRQ